MENFYDNGLNFECQRCSLCCGHAPGFVYLSQYDLERLCAHLELSEKDFIEKYCRWAMYYEGKEVLALKEKKNYDCFLWDNGCSVYSSRPLQCSTYPFWSWMINDKATWDSCGNDCPGINHGRKWTKEEILEQKNLYDENTPLEKEKWLSKYRSEQAETGSIDTKLN